MLPRATERFIFVMFGYTRPHYVNVLPHSFYVRSRIACAAAQFNALPRTPWCRARGSTPHRRQRAAAQFLRSAAHRLCCRAIQRAAAHPLVPRVRQYASSFSPVLPRSSTCCRSPWCRAVQRAAALHGAARGRTPVSSPVLPRSSTCCRAPLGAARAAVRLIVFACAAAQFNVLPRSMVPRAAERLCLRLCCRPPWCRARCSTPHRRQCAAAQFLRSAAHHLCCRAVQRAAAHPLVPRVRQYASSSSPVLPRSSTCCRAPWCRARQNACVFACAAALHGAARAAVRLIVVNVLPRSFYVRLRIACAAAQFNVLPRTPWCRACGSTPHRLRLCCRAVQRAAALHGAALRRTPVSSPMLPRSSTCCRAPWCRARQNACVFACAAALSYCRAPWCRAPVCRRSPMVPRVRPNGLKFCVLPRPMVPRSSTCCRVPCCRAVPCVAASHAAAQFPVLPRPMLPRSSTCCRVPCCRAVPCVAASHAAALRSTCGRASVLSAAQFYVLPRSMVPRPAQRFGSSPCCRAVVWIAIKGRLVPQSASVARQPRWRLVVVG